MGYSISHKGYVYYDPCSNKFHISRHVVFFENQSFFSTHVASFPEIHVLPNFDELNSIPERFKPGIVYERRRPIFLFPEQDSSFEPIPFDHSMINSTSNTKVRHPLDRYGFSHTSLHTTLTPIPIPKCYLEAIKHGCWRAGMAEEL